MPSKKRAQPETQLQKQIAEWFQYCGPKGMMMRMVENRPRSKISGALQKARGVKAGFPDIILWWYGEVGAAVELKSKRGVQSEAQKEFQREYEKIGGYYAICRSLDEFVSIIMALGFKPRGRIAA